MCLLCLTCLLCPTFEMAAQWQKIRLGMLEINEHIHNIVFTSPDDCYLSLDKGIIRSLERGRWTKRTIIDGSIREIVFPTPTVGYAVGSKVWKTTNAGDTWFLKISQPPCASLDAYSVIVTESNRLVIAGGYCGVLYSDDGGITWEISQADASFGMLISRAIAAGPAGVLWVGIWNTGIFGEVSYMLISTNGGENWTRLFHWDEWHATSLFRPNMVLYGLGNKLWVAGERRTARVRKQSSVFRSSDLGQTWDTVSGPFQNDVRAMAFANERVGYIGDVAGNIYSTSDGGETWHNENAPSEGRAINAITVTTGGEVYAVGEYGILLRRDLPTSVTEAQPPTTLRLYPNPTTGVVTVESDFGPAQLFVVDVLGTVVLQVQAESKTTIDLSAYPSGMYRVIAQTSAGICAETVAVVR